MDPDDIKTIVSNLNDKSRDLFGPPLPKIFAPGLRQSENDRRNGASKQGRPYTKPPLRTKAVKAKAKTRRKMAQASRRINRGK